mgnify:FL=1
MSSENTQVVDFVQVADEALKKAQQMSQETSDGFNIFVVGKSGVGKSTLINAVFGEKLAKTGSGSPKTQNIKEYKSKDFSIFDTKGLELEDYDSTKAQIAEFLAQKQIGNEDEQIHIAWLCIAESGRRIERADIELWELLQKNHIPSILVITKAEQDKDENGELFSQLVKKEFKTEEVQRVRALQIEDDEGNLKKVKGIDMLVSKTYFLAPQAKRNAFGRKQIYDKAMQRQERKKRADSIINLYTAAASTVAASPIPFSDIAILLPTQAAMIVHISSIYDLELSLESAKKLSLAFGAVVGVGFAARAVAANLVKFIPVVGSVAGGVINAGVAGTITKLMGEAYIAYLDDNAENLSEAVQKLSKDIIELYINKVKK